MKVKTKIFAAVLLALYVVLGTQIYFDFENLTNEYGREKERYELMARQAITWKDKYQRLLESKEPVDFKTALEYIETRNDKKLLLQIAILESGAKQYGVTTGTKGEKGAMQINEITALEFECGDRNNIVENIKCGDKKMRYCLDKYESIESALCCYNGSDTRPDGGCRYSDKYLIFPDFGDKK